MTGAGALQRTFEAVTPLLQRALGAEDGTIVRPYTLRDRVEGRAVAVLELAAEHAAGAAVLALRSTTGNAIQGSLPAGLVLTVGGEDVEVAETVSAQGGGSTISVTVSPPLAGTHGDGVEVSLADKVELAFPRTQGGALVESLVESDTPQRLIGQASVTVSLAKRGAPGTPQRGDLIALASGRRFLLQEIAEDGEGWWVFYGGER